MKRFLAVALVSAGIGLCCAGSAGQPRVDADYEESFGEIVDVASVAGGDGEVLVVVRAGDEMLPFYVGIDTHLTVGGVVIERSELPDYVGFSAVVLYREQQAGRREAQFIGVERWPARKRAWAGFTLDPARTTGDAANACIPAPPSG
jgi:hypothetical protein